MKINELLNESEQIDEVPKWMGGTGGQMPGTTNGGRMAGVGNWLKKKTGFGRGAEALKQADKVANYAYKKWVNFVPTLQGSGKLMAGDNVGYVNALSQFARKQFGLEDQTALLKFAATVGNMPTKATIVKGFTQAFQDALVQNQMGSNKQSKTALGANPASARTPNRIKTGAQRKASNGQLYKIVKLKDGSREWHDLTGNRADDAIQNELGKKYGI